MRKWTISEIKQANAEAGGVFFSPDTMKFFKSKIYPYVYQGPGGIAFVTRETFVGSDGTSRTTYTVRHFDPETGRVHNNDGSETKYIEDARQAAKDYAKGGE